MKYLALGDSISIDDYTGVAGGGAASQFARLIDADVVWDVTRDGCTTAGVLEALQGVHVAPDVVTLTAGGNDLLQALAWDAAGDRASPAAQPLRNLERIAATLRTYACPVIVNTVYDPTDGSDLLAEELTLPPEMRLAFNELNDGIRALARANGFLLSDLEVLFAGHGARSAETWIVLDIEPNHAGATVIARHWYTLFTAAATGA